MTTREVYQGPIRVGDHVEAWIAPRLYAGTIAKVLDPLSDSLGDPLDFFDVRCDDGTIIRMSRRDIGRHWPGAARSNTMGAMIENNAPEAAEPQTPEPEDDTPPWPSPEAIAGATNLAMLASTLAARDPEEAGRLMRTAAELIDPQPTFWEKVGRGLDGPIGEKLADQFGEIARTLVERSTQPAATFEPCLRRGPMSIRQVPLGPVYDYPGGPLGAADPRFRVDSAGNVHDRAGYGNGAGGPYLDTYDAKGRAVTLWGEDLDQRALDLLNPPPLVP